MGQVVVVNGAGGLLGRRVVHVVAQDPGVDRVVAIDRYPFPLARRSESTAVVERFVGAHALDEAAAAVGEVAAVIHLGPTSTGDAGPDGTATATSGPQNLRELLDRLPDPLALVVLSSATVYGAWADNPVPLTEAAPLRPLPGSTFAVERLALEEVARAWGARHPATTVALLRPTVVACAETRRWFAASPWATSVPEGDGAAPRQLLHLDDLVAAIDQARTECLDGPFNVAPDGWMPPEALAALAGPAGRIRGVARSAARRVPGGGAGGHDALLGEGYRVEPWVVAADRLRATGWVPRHSNEEVFVEADASGGLTSLSAKRRQQLSLGASAAVVAVIAGAGALLVRRRRD